MYDIIIVGAGPAGCSCALHLADTSLKILLLDKEVFPRDKICGDALSMNVSYELSKMSLPLIAAYETWEHKIDTYGMRFFSPTNEYIDIPFPTPRHKVPPSGFVAKRVDFDNFLFENVRKYANIEILEGVEVRNIEITKEKVTVFTDNQVFESKIIIGADGAQSVVAKYNGFTIDKKYYSAGLRTYYEGVSGFNEGNFIEIHFIKNVLPGYFWIFPLPNGGANIGLGMLSEAVSNKKVNLRAVLNDIIQKHPTIAPRFANAVQIDKIRGFGLPLGSKKQRLSNERLLLLGDAASLIDPFSGEGVGNALLSGRIAAGHLKTCFVQNDFSAKKMAAYDELLFEKIGSELKISHMAQKMLNYPKLCSFLVRKATKNESVRKLMMSMFDNLSIKKELSNPLFYLKLFLK
jgi:geranylgeranyl reductase family protein